MTVTNAIPPVYATERGGLPFRVALHDWDHVRSTLKAQGTSGDDAPQFTIAITTFNRPKLLLETVRSALEQSFGGRPYEIIVLDNNPASTVADSLLEKCPALRSANFRYFVHEENIGMFGNFNRCITLARAPWLTILNDDDLLDPDYLAQMADVIARTRGIDGLVARKRFFETTPDGDAAPHAAPPPSFLQQTAATVRHHWTYLGRTSRRIGPGKFFWGAILGNGAGFVFRKSKAIEIGGFYPEEYPSSDYWFFARFALLGHLREYSRQAASVRITGENVTAATVKLALTNGIRLQRSLIGTHVPRFYRHLLPLMIARWKIEYKQKWHGDVSTAELESALGLRLPRDRRLLLYILRLGLRGT